ncbi:hypothetical protein BTO05_04595 [Winogradskyella sp. PC-19]|uniref:glycosyltransferase family 4 protein n=1 Tax=unclassified Winogradskyella TaxID=2615021 RepID=UPI000B3C7E60|nr:MULTISPECIES: glycosyltransferase family 4 protein [unclassified Winogradskyella]ARV08947.1 hypothetical protein BTO05_04595 [Winogradskyella sp. PC-19]
MSDKKEHIVILTSEFPPLPGGIGNHACNLAENLTVSGYRVSVIADQRADSNQEVIFDKSLKSKIYRVKKVSIRSLMYLKRIWLSFKLSKSADVLICSGKFPLWIGAVLKPIIKAKVIAVIHGTEVNFSNQNLKKSISISLQRFDKVIAVSNYTKNLVSHLKLKNTMVIPNGFEISNFSSSAASIINLKGSPSLLTVGNLTERKGQAKVIEYLPSLIKKYPDLHYHCVGLKTEIDKYRRLCDNLGVSKYVTFHGHVGVEKLHDFYRSSDIFVMLSQNTASGDIEGFGIALIEANYFRLPTIGSRNCGIEDAINHQNSGLLVDSSKIKEFENAIFQILNNLPHYKVKAKIWAEKHQWSQIIKRYISFIKS